MNEEEQKYFDKGYHDQCWRYPLLEHYWKDRDLLSSDIYKAYKNGCVQAYEDGLANCPYFHYPYTEL